MEPKKKTLADDLYSLNIADNIKECADTIFRSMNNMCIRRGKKRRQLVFVCCRYAYQKLEVAYDPIALGQNLKLTKSDMTNAMATYSSLQTGVGLECRPTSPLSLLPEFCNQLGLIDDISIEEILEMARGLLAKYTQLTEIKPYAVAAGILAYYFKINGLPCENISKVCHVPENIVTLAYRRISTLDNPEIQ